MVSEQQQHGQSRVDCAPPDALERHPTRVEHQQHSLRATAKGEHAKNSEWRTCAHLHGEAERAPHGVFRDGSAQLMLVIS